MEVANVLKAFGGKSLNLQQARKETRRHHFIWVFIFSLSHPSGIKAEKFSCKSLLFAPIKGRSQCYTSLHCN